MLPCPCANITRSSCFMLSSVPSTLVSKVALYVSADCSVTGPGLPSVPAVLTAASSLPKRATALSTNPRTSSSRRTSARRNTASAPSSRSSATTRSPSSARRPDTTTRAPSVAKARAVARPIPVSAPVIKTTGVFMSSSSAWVRRTAPRASLESIATAVPCQFPRITRQSRIELEPKFQHLPKLQRGPRGGGSERLDGPEAMPVDSQLPDLRLERLPGYAELGGGTGSPRDRARALPQRLLDHLPLALDEVGDQRSSRRAGLRLNSRKPRLIDREGIPVAQDHTPLDDVLQLANVARPIVRLELVQSALRHVSNDLAGLLGEPTDEGLDEQRDIVDSLA